MPCSLTSAARRTAPTIETMRLLSSPLPDEPPPLGWFDSLPPSLTLSA